MNVIRHDHVTANRNVVLLCSNTKRVKDFVDFIARQQSHAFMCIERHKIKRPHRREKEFKSRRTFRKPTL
jgi:hypothetical protein